MRGVKTNFDKFEHSYLAYLHDRLETLMKDSGLSKKGNIKISTLFKVLKNEIKKKKDKKKLKKPLHS